MRRQYIGKEELPVDVGCQDANDDGAVVALRVIIIIVREGIEYWVSKERAEPVDVLALGDAEGGGRKE